MSAVTRVFHASKASQTSVAAVTQLRVTSFFTKTSVMTCVPQVPSSNTSSVSPATLSVSHVSTRQGRPAPLVMSTQKIPSSTAKTVVTLVLMESSEIETLRLVSLAITLVNSVLTHPRRAPLAVKTRWTSFTLKTSV